MILLSKMISKRSLLMPTVTWTRLIMTKHITTKPMTKLRGSYMSAHVLLNSLNELGKRDKMRGLSSILYPFCNEFNKFNNKRARMLESI